MDQKVFWLSSVWVTADVSECLYSELNMGGGYSNSCSLRCTGKAVPSTKLAVKGLSVEEVQQKVLRTYRRSLQFMLPVYPTRCVMRCYVNAVLVYRVFAQERHVYASNSRLMCLEWFNRKYRYVY